VRLGGALLVLGLTVGGSACVGDGGAIEGSPSPVATAEVTATGSNLFSPQHVAVSAGGTVTWTWSNVEPGHNVVADDGSFSSGDPEGSGTFTRTFDEPGTVRYYCAVHGTKGGVGMSGTVTVT